MSLLEALLFGIVEGITEFLPVSSTGHLILAARLLEVPETDFLKTFQVVIQLGAIAAVMVLYSRRLLADRVLIQKIIVALLPALGVGYVFYQFIRSLFDSPLVVVQALFWGGALLVGFEFMLGRREETERQELTDITYATAFKIGLFQTLAVIPGVSRAGATIIGGLFLGLKRRAIVEFSFLLAVPTMLAATVLDLWKHGATFSSDDFSLLLVGFVTAFVVAVLVIKLLLRFVETHTFVAFGVYRMIVAMIFFFFVL